MGYSFSYLNLLRSLNCLYVWLSIRRYMYIFWQIYCKKWVQLYFIFYLSSSIHPSIYPIVHLLVYLSAFKQSSYLSIYTLFYLSAQLSANLSIPDLLVYTIYIYSSTYYKGFEFIYQFSRLYIYPSCVWTYV